MGDVKDMSQFKGFNDLENYLFQICMCSVS